MNIWIWDIARQALTRLTDTPLFDGVPLWSRDGRLVIFASGRNGPQSLFTQAADGSAPAQELFKVSTLAHPMSLTGDGLHLLYDYQNEAHNSDIMMIPLQGTITPDPPVLDSEYEEPDDPKA